MAEGQHQQDGMFFKNTLRACSNQLRTMRGSEVPNVAQDEALSPGAQQVPAVRRLQRFFSHTQANDRFDKTGSSDSLDKVWDIHPDACRS